MDLELRARGQYFSSPLETIALPIAELLKPVIERESPMNINWVETVVGKCIKKLRLSEHPESVVTFPHNVPVHQQ